MACLSENRRMTILSVLILGGALAAVMMAYFVFGDTNDEMGLRTLRMISIISRHGDRSPTEVYPKDPYRNFEWVGGLGSLSERGALQMHNLGRSLRMRYYRLLPPNGLYTAQDMHIVSSYAERCIMSAQSLMAGFMPPLENRNILPIQWQPIAVNTIPRDRDMLIAQKRACAKYDEMLRKLYTKPPPDLKSYNDQYSNLYTFLSKHTGQNITNVLGVELLHNTLQIESDSGLVLPDWTETVFPDKMLPLAERSLALLTETPLMKRIKGGALITEIYENMVKKRSSLLNPNRKIFLYSGHDVTLVAIMNSLGILEQTSRKPNYAATLVFEAHSVTFDDDFEVKLVYYFDSEDKFPKEIYIPNCDSPCSLTNFGKAIENLILKNYEEACEI